MAQTLGLSSFAQISKLKTILELLAADVETLRKKVDGLLAKSEDYRMSNRLTLGNFVLFDADLA